MKTASSGQRISKILKLKELLRQFGMLLRERNPARARDFSYLSGQFQEYDALSHAYIGKSLANARIFEVGCGQRPYRLFYMIARGADAAGIDMDKVVLSINSSVISDSLRQNGFERTLKTVLRYVIFDRSENRQFKAFLENVSGERFDWPIDKIAYGSAADASLWPSDPVDFIFSEDVFEHIPAEVLPDVCANMAAALSKRGIAFIRPMIYTGIMGGHNVEWYDAISHKPRECPPWDHLRNHRYPANTYLNQVRLPEYRSIFSKHFEILEEIRPDTKLGEAYFTPEIRAELSSYTDEELFANQVGFVLRAKHS